MQNPEWRRLASHTKISINSIRSQSGELDMCGSRPIVDDRINRQHWRRLQHWKKIRSFLQSLCDAGPEGAVTAVSKPPWSYDKYVFYTHRWKAHDWHFTMQAVAMILTKHIKRSFIFISGGGVITCADVGKFYVQAVRNCWSWMKKKKSVRESSAGCMLTWCVMRRTRVLNNVRI